MTEIVNARIKSTMLGIEDHGFLTFFIDLDFGNSGQGFGGYALDYYDPEIGHRVGIEHGLTMIRSILETIEVNTWEELTRQYIRVERDGCYIVRIGHIIKDQWFSYS